jgi:hypothetical protein
MPALVQLAAELLKLGIAQSTRATYESACRSYIRFAECTGSPTKPPIDPQSIVLWMTWLFADNKAVSSVRTYLYGINSWHIEEGHPSPLRLTHHVWRCWKGMKRWKGDANERVRLPVTTKLLMRIKSTMQLESSIRDRMMWAAFTLGTCGLLRLSEFAVTSGREDRVLRWRDIQWFDSNEKQLPLLNGQVQSASAEYRVFIATSKTDPFRLGVSIRICAPIAVKAMRSYCNRLPFHPPFNGFLFDFGKAVSNEKPLALSRDVVVSSLKSYLKLLGESAEKYNGHSFRKGGAQSLAEAGIPTDIIQVMGRWTSDCYKLYISTPARAITDAALALEPESFV